MRIPLLLTLALVPITHAAAAAQQIGPALPRITKPPQPKCEENPADGEEIVVCGQRYDEDSPYRIPRELRNRGPVDDRQQSWDARVRDMESVDRYSSQTVGPFGYLQRSEQMKCEWLADRQLAQGRQPDCTRKPRPDAPTDWQRR
jgi:hypothetical protein